MTDFDAAAERLRAERQAETRRREEKRAATLAKLDADTAAAVAKMEAEAQAWRDEVAWFVEKAHEAGRPTVPLRYRQLIPVTPKRSWWGGKQEQPPHESNDVEHPYVRGWVLEGEPYPVSSDRTIRVKCFVTEDRQVYDLVDGEGFCTARGNDAALDGEGHLTRHFRQGAVPQPTERAMRGWLVREVGSWY